MKLKCTLFKTVMLLAMILLIGRQATAQCFTAPNGQYPAGTFTPNSTLCNGLASQTVTAAAWCGEYSLVQLAAGQTYTFTSSVATDYVTVSDNAGVTALAFGTTPVTYVSASAQTVRFYLHLGATCLAQNTSRTRAVICGVPPANDANVTNIYTVGKLPLVFGDNHIVQARVVNSGTNALTNLNVTLDITGANTFSDVQTIASLAPNAVQIVNFMSFTPVSLGNNSLVVSVPLDDVNTNDTIKWTQEVTQNLTTYKDGTIPNAGGVGFNLATGDFVAKFTSAVAAQVNEIQVDFFAGGQPYQLGIWDATGTGGAPGTNLWTSASGTSAAGTAFIPVPNISVTGDYYVGVMQTGTSNVSFAYQNEAPIRAGTFYYTSPTGSTNWIDFSPASPFRFSIAPQYFMPQPPNCATAFAPADNAGNVDFNSVTSLSWASGGGGATDYDVYFGTTYPPPFVGNQTTTTFPVSLSASTTYYWHVLAKNTYGSAVGCDTMEFTTVTPASNDECANAVVLIPDPTLTCTTPTPGTLV